MLFNWISNIYRYTFKINEHVLINDNINIENHTIKRRNSKYGKWPINDIIIKIYSNSSYKVKIVNDFKDIIFANKEYYINITTIKKLMKRYGRKLIMKIIKI